MDKRIKVLVSLNIKKESFYKKNNITIAQRIINLFKDDFFVLLKLNNLESKNDINDLFSDIDDESISILDENKLDSESYKYPNFRIDGNIIFENKLKFKLVEFFDKYKNLINEDSDFNILPSKEGYTIISQDPNFDWGYMDDTESSNPFMSWGAPLDEDHFEYEDIKAYLVTNKEDMDKIIID